MTVKRLGRAPAVREALAVLGVWLLGAAVFFREQWTSGFRTMMGNDGDTRLIGYLCEHWFRVFHGDGSWLNPQFFYPVKGLLGWSDTFFLYEIFYTPLRLLGLDQFLALQATDILLSFLGFASFVYLVRAAFAAPMLLALPLGLAFAFSNALWLQAGAYDDSGIYFVPLILLLALGAWRAAAAGRKWRSVVMAAGCGLLYALLLYSSYYTGYFVFLVVGLLALVLLVSRPRRSMAWARSALTTRWPTLAVALAGFAVGIVPFALTYIPARHDAPGSSYAIVMLYAPRLVDLVDFGTGNIFWSSAVHAALPRLDATLSYRDYSVTPVIMIGAVVGGALCAWWLRTGRARSPGTARAAAALAATAVLTELLPLHTRFGTPWAVIYHFPGASAMRVTGRIYIIANLVALLALSAGLMEAWSHTLNKRRLVAPVVIALVVVLAAAEQIDTTGSSAINRHTQNSFLASVTPAPAGCRAFYVTDSKDPSLPFYESQIDAMLISQKLGLPTVNGYTGYNPPGWNLTNVGSPGYLDQVRSWVQAKGIDGGLCQLDLGTMEWDPVNTL